jgi:WD40 repeat protein
MSVSLRDALVHAAGPFAVAPPEREIERRVRRMRRNSRLLETGVVVVVAFIVALGLLPGDDGHRVRTVPPVGPDTESEANVSEAPVVEESSQSVKVRSAGPATGGVRPTSADPASNRPSPQPTRSEIRLAYLSGSGVATMLPDGTDRRLLFTSPDPDYRPVGWSPDRQRLAMIVQNYHDRSLATAKLTALSPTKVVTPTDAVLESADWSPDGKWLVYSTRAPAEPRWNNLRLVRPDGSDDHELPLQACRPAWAPDSRHIAAVSCGGSGEQLGMTIIDVTTGDMVSLHDRHMYAVSWSPDGNWIAGPQYDETPQTEPTHKPNPLVMFHPDGSGLRILKSGTTWERPAWTTDSKRLIYTKYRPLVFPDDLCGAPSMPPCDDRPYGLYSIPIDGSSETMLTKTGEHAPVMPWS